MKNKKYMTYILLAASVLIWGTIAWRFYNAFKKEPIIVEETRIKPFVKKKDSVELLLNYNDPFLGKLEQTSLQNEVDAKDNFDDLNQFIPPDEPEIVYGPAFKFKGILKVGKILYGLLDFEGETIMVSRRDKVGDFYIVSITSDKMVVRRQGLDMDVFAE